MATSSSICLFHDRRYSSNIQHILNLLRKNSINIKCDLNLIAKNALCICQLSSNPILLTDEQLIKKQKEFEGFQTTKWFKEINHIIRCQIVNTCQDQISIYKLLTLICNISNKRKFFQMVTTSPKDGKSKVLNQRADHSNLIRRRIELSLVPNQVGHLLGREGHFHKKMMKKTKTRIHFENAPYSIDSSTKQYPEFDLDLFQSSSSSLKAIITGETIEAVENATKELEKLVKTTQTNLSYFYQN